MSVHPSARRVAFQGVRGAFSEEAAQQLLGAEIRLVACPTFESLFTAVAEGAAACALAPVENSLAGSVHKVYELLLTSALHISAEVIIPIHHYLIGCPGATFEQIKTVASHPVALAQCELFFAAHPAIQRLATEDTAESVAQIVRRGDPSCAAIASQRAAEIYGGTILRARLEDHRENYTRFVLLTPTATQSETADKLSLVLRLAPEPGALYRALAPCARRGVDLLKLETHPIRGQPWQYHFFLDLLCAHGDAAVADLLAELRECALEVRILGHYPSAGARFGSSTDPEGITI